MRFLPFLFIPLLALARPVTLKSHNTITPTLSTQVALAQNKERMGLIISNKGTDAVLIKFGSSISASEGVRLAASSNIDFNNVPMDSINVKLAASTGSNTMEISEFE